MLLAFEDEPGSVVGKRDGSELYGKVITISPLRTGRVWYLIYPTTRGVTVASAERHAANIVNKYGVEETIEMYKDVIGMDKVVEVTANACIATPFWDNGGLKPWGAIPENYITYAVPIKWEGMEKPPTLMAEEGLAPGAATGSIISLFGAAPDIEFPEIPPRKIKVKPGTSIDVSTVLKMIKEGGTFESMIRNPITGMSAAERFGLNAGDTTKVVCSDTMPALNPGEVLNVITSFSQWFCDFEALTDSEAVYRRLMDELLPGITVPPKEFTTVVEPTDCLLVDTSKGLQVLGDGISFNGVIVSSKSGALSGTAPYKLEFEDLRYLRLDFTRDIALCENRSLLDKSGKTYEYSTIPTPFMTLQRSRAFARQIRPAMPWEGPPLPMWMVKGPRIKSMLVSRPGV